jgi:threonine aldolase
MKLTFPFFILSTVPSFWQQASALAAAAPSSAVSLQTYHPVKTPSQTLRELAEQCVELGIDSFDVYGDFADDADAETSFLRKFERELAREFNKEDAVIMPSGTMAQQIALLVHKETGNGVNRFACHATSHLLLHEENAYKELSQMGALVIRTAGSEPLHTPPLMFIDVEERALSDRYPPVSTLMIELPHRELGGKLPPWEDVVQMSAYCRQRGIRFHCDGARIFEASAGYDLPLPRMAAVFDSIYISFYKGLGGLSGSALLGNTEFCQQARTWLTRFGGNLYTLLPYVVSGMVGYRKYWSNVESSGAMTFAEKKEKIKEVVAALSNDDLISTIVVFDPEQPETNMVHGYFRYSVDACLAAADKAAAAQAGTHVLHRLRDLPNDHPAAQVGFRSYFELTIGELNGRVETSTYLKGWRAFAEALLAGRGVS